MNIKRFFGKNSREALALVKKALGENAVILSNRKVDGGNEIMAFKEDEINALIQDEMQDTAVDIEAFGFAKPEHQAPDFTKHAEIQQQSGIEPAKATQQIQAAQHKPDFMRADMSKANQSAPKAPTMANSQAMHQQTAAARSPINEAFKQIDQPTQAPAGANDQHAMQNSPAPAQLAAQPVQHNQQQAANMVAQNQATQNQTAVNQAITEQAPLQQPAQQPAATTAEVKQDNAQLAAMLGEMSQMRREIESQLTSFKQTELKPLETLPRNVNKVAKQKKAPKPQQSPQMQAMLAEMRNMRSAFESQLTSLNWANIAQRDPVRSALLTQLLSAGFSASLSRQMAERIPEQIDGKPTTEATAKAWMQRILSLNLNTVAHENELFDQGGAFALIGPTGVGKTTTTAKLAARYVMKHGTENLGIITTDAYRVGGYEQLRIYGKILGVMVHAVKDETDLKIALNELKNKHTILIDTVGVSQKDRMVAEQIAMLSNTQRPIKKLLCVNATNTGETLTDVVRAYKGKGLDGAILTKVDEAATIGNALDVLIRNKLKLFYTTNGQRVPEDIEHSDKQALIEQAFTRNEASQSPFEFLEEELPFVMGNMTKETHQSVSEAVDHV